MIGMHQKSAFHWIRTVLLEPHGLPCAYVVKDTYITQGLRLILGCLALYLYCTNVDNLRMLERYLQDINLLLLLSGYLQCCLQSFSLFYYYFVYISSTCTEPIGKDCTSIPPVLSLDFHEVADVQSSELDALLLWTLSAFRWQIKILHL